MITSPGPDPTKPMIGGSLRSSNHISKNGHTACAVLLLPAQLDKTGKRVRLSHERLACCQKKADQNTTYKVNVRIQWYFERVRLGVVSRCDSYSYIVCVCGNTGVGVCLPGLPLRVPRRCTYVSVTGVLQLNTQLHVAVSGLLYQCEEGSLR